MNVQTWLKQATHKLDEADIATARLDSLVLLEDVTGLDRAQLLAEPDTELSSAKQAKLKKLLNRRIAHEPLAYVRGRTEFYGRNFVITPAVLEPRPESETMIDLLKTLASNEAQQHNNDQKLRIADVGTGSGALGITAALEVPNCEVDLLDIDPKALKIAIINVDKFTLSLSVKRSDLLASSAKDYDILLCNLPYVPDSHTINQAAGFEPRSAIFGGPDGLDLYRRLFDQVAKLQNRALYLLIESLPPQHADLKKIASGADYKLQRTDDFIQVFETA
ncbi:MAG: HemK/PrmC family methyltransferase [Patescibacteria group bacterium]